ncbi:MAG: FAD-binding protein [Ilumatobacteraceae bacterium]
MDLSAFATEVGGLDAGFVTIAGVGTRRGAVPGVRTVSAPAGVEWIQADEMTVSCGAATLVADLDAALAEHGQCIALPRSGTVGGALAVGHSDIRRLGYGHMRDALLETHYVSAIGEIVKAGGPTVKNVSGFDLCRLLVGSFGTLGFLGSVILRTRPLPAASQWFVSTGDPWTILADLYRPVSVLWDGESTWVLLEGHPDDIDEQSRLAHLEPTIGPPKQPSAARWSMTPSSLRSLTGSAGFVAEIGVGVVHHTQPAPRRVVSSAITALHQRMKHEFDPTGRFNPGVDVLAG